MRKLTGYIGAMIIVIALMGSILAGYALNINGTSTVMNEYEKVTDVSGLYTHTQEPSYIDYNPASNYIGYSIGQTVFENTGLPMKRMLNGETVTVTLGSGFSYNGKNYGFPDYNTVVIGSSYGYLYSIPGNPGIYWTSSYGDYGVSTITITWANNVLTVTDNINTRTLNTGIAPFIYYPYSDYDSFFSSYGNFYYNPGVQNQFLGIGSIDPRYNNNNIFITGVGWTATRCIPYGDEINTTDAFYFNYDTVISNGVHRGVTTVVYNYGGSLFTLWGVLGPRYVYADDTLGVDYTESNRVNNYPVVKSDATTTTEVTTLTVGNLSATDYWPEVPNGWLKTGYLIWETQPVYPHDTITAPYYYTTINLNDYNYGATMLHQYKLSDILVNYNIPIGTQTLKITTNSNDIRAYPYYSLDANIIGFVNASNNGFIQSFNDIAYKKDYLIYDIPNNVCTVYNYNGVALFTNTPENIGVIFCDNTGADYMRYNHYETVNDHTSGYFDMDSRPIPFITITASIYNPADIDYIDITKGYNIKSTNVVNTIWDNEYNNGDIKLLFRAETTPGTYHNSLIVGDNNISIDYNTNRYIVTLNGGDPVDVGTWRNIILDIDMINGELSVIPVRTFNNFTNVGTDNTNIFIGDLINPTPTNIIEWVPTTNSLTFNVYSTSVFMDTYGVVMVNPTLNITDYFTNLNNFYQLKISNISVVGQSMTVNGITGTVTGNTVTFNDETIQIKDMTITYADGHVYISDSHVSIDLGEITDNNISMSGAWYFITDLMRGYTTQKMIYEWDWQDFILDNVQFCVIYIGLALIGLLIARRYCTLTITDYAIFMVSIIIALTVQVVA